MKMAESNRFLTYLLLDGVKNKNQEILLKKIGSVDTNNFSSSLDANLVYAGTKNKF
jgi:hypothetical protein